MLRRRLRPTPQEIRAAIPPEGIRLAEFVELIGWRDTSDETKSQIFRLLAQISVGNLSTMTIHLKGPLTAREIVAAIPVEGITPPELCQKLEARIQDSEEYLEFMMILSDVAVWDVESQRIVISDANNVSVSVTGLLW